MEEKKEATKIYGIDELMPKETYLLGREKALENEAARLKAERLEEENKNLILRVASAEMHADSVSKTADKMKELLDDAAELMRQYDALLVRLLDLNKKMNKWLGR